MNLKEKYNYATSLVETCDHYDQLITNPQVDKKKKSINITSSDLTLYTGKFGSSSIGDFAPTNQPNRQLSHERIR